jgi:hypothetical protein
MNVSKKDEQREQLRQALAAYAGPVTRCPPGEAKAKQLPPTDPAERRAERWLRRHANDRPVIDPKEERRRKRMARARRQRIAERNAALLKGGT